MTIFTPISVSIKQQLLTQLYEQFEDTMFLLDANLRYLSVNAVYEIMIGYKESFLIGRPLGIYADEFLSKEELELLHDITTSLNITGFYQREFSMSSRYGQTFDCHMTCSKTCLNNTVYYVGIIRDIAPIVKNKKRMLRLLNFDHLTALPNGNIFLSQSNELLKKSRQEVVVVRLNIDRYRLLASTLGPDNINTLVKDFVARVNKLALDNLQCFAHFGGDDFALLFEFSDAHMARNQLDRLMQMSERPFSLDGNVIYLHISAGASYFPDHGRQSSELIANAEKALHYIKQHGGDDVCWYSAALNNTSTDSLQLEAELRAAIYNCQFIAHYQPKVTLETGAITGFEALVRWQHPTRGLLHPIDFIDAVIQNKLSFELFNQMATQITKQLAAWQALGFTQHVCINADAAEFSRPEFFDVVSQLLSKNNIHADQLHIEVTESSLMLRHTSVKQQLTSLKELGICLALDDFGTGYASLSYLQEFPFDFIKIDKSFISKIATDHTQYAIVKAILDLADALGMQVVAEGIETKQQRDLLLKMGCKLGQGYWFGRPMTAGDATNILAQQYSSK